MPYRGPRAGRDPNKLTAREEQVFTLAASCMTNEKIGAALGCSARTVDAHIRNILQKLGLKKKYEIPMYAERLRDKIDNGTGPDLPE